MGSYFKGWSDTLPHIMHNTPAGGSQNIFAGQVLKVFYKDKGKISVRLLGVSKEQKDDDVKLEAYPANLNIIKYPLPGELVVIFTGLKNEFKKKNTGPAYYYLSVISVNSHLTYNSNPNVGITVPTNMINEVFTSDYYQRFEHKIETLKSYMTDPSNPKESIVNKVSIQPTEGDTILQGRFGSSIRLGGTVVPSNNAEGLMESITSADTGTKAGDSMIVMTVNPYQDTMKQEIVNAAPEEIDITKVSTVHVASSQNIPIDLSTSQELRTHKRIWNLSMKTLIDGNKVSAGLSVDTDQISSFLQTSYIPGQVAVVQNVFGQETAVSGDLASYNFHQIPGTTCYRSAQLPANLFATAIQTYGIKRVVRMNGDGSDSGTAKVSQTDEQTAVTAAGAAWEYQYAQSGYKWGQGYTTSANKIVPILQQGNALIHCAHGADRTGYIVAMLLKNLGLETDKDKLWAYTVQFNSWDDYMNDGTLFDSNIGFAKYADAFYPIESLIVSKWNPKPPTGTPAQIKTTIDAVKAKT